MRTVAAAVFVLVCASSASAQLKLEFDQGKVTIDATAVPVKTILAEWGRLGGTKVVGAEKVSGAPLTIRLESVPEAQALEIVLRNVAGYMAAPRQAESLGASAYDRILVMPTSSAPQSASAGNAGRPAGPANTAAGGPRPGRGAFGAQAPGQDVQPPEPVAENDEADTGVNEPAFQFPQPTNNPFQAIGQPGAFAQPGVQPAVGQPGPFGTPMAPGAQPPVISFGPGGASQGVSINPAPPQQTAPVMQFPGAVPPPGTTPGGFGVVGAPTPGVIMQPTQPGQPVRPPGDR